MYEKGDEIGMLDFDDISWKDTKDPAACNTNPQVYKLYSRDPERTPFQVINNIINFKSNEIKIG